MKKVVYKNDWFSVQKDGKWHYIKEKNADNGAVILIEEDNKYFIFVKIYRKAIDKTVIELPRGYGEDGETSLVTAKREALEETGYDIDLDSIVNLGSIYPNSAILTSKIDIYLARVSEKNKIQSSDNEVIDIYKIDKTKLTAYIQNGTIQDSFSLAALSLYQHR